jgi:hypothetical protein
MGILQPIYLGTFLWHHNYASTLNGMGRLFSRLGENPFNDIRAFSL